MEPLILRTIRRYRTSGTAPDEGLSRDEAGPLVYLDDVETWLLKRADQFSEKGRWTVANVIRAAAADLVAPPCRAATGGTISYHGRRIRDLAAVLSLEQGKVIEADVEFLLGSGVSFEDLRIEHCAGRPPRVVVAGADE